MKKLDNKSNKEKWLEGYKDGYSGKELKSFDIIYNKGYIVGLERAIQVGLIK